MGNSCCTEQEIIFHSKKIIKAHIDISNTKKQGIRNQQGNIHVYDIEFNHSNFFPVKFNYIKNFDSFSQVSDGNLLYLCGENDNKVGGNTLVKIDISTSIKNVTILVDSIYLHYKPSISIIKDLIYVIGGRNSIKSEFYSINNNKWKSLPDLPEERFGAGIIDDNNKSENFYLFGGKNLNKYLSSFLKFNIKQNLWETIILNDESSILQRAFFGIYKISTSNSILLLGGDRKENCYEIVKFNQVDYTGSILPFTLEKPGNFDNNLISEYCGAFYLFDNCNIIHKVTLSDQKSEIVSCFDKLEYNNQIQN